VAADVGFGVTWLKDYPGYYVRLLPHEYHDWLEFVRR